MLEIIISKQIDIYIGIILAVFGAMVGLVLNKLFANNVTSGSNNNVVTFTTINNNVYNYNMENQNENQDNFIYVLIFVFILLTVYFFFRSIILSFLLYSQVILFSCWISYILSGFIRGNYKGIIWIIYSLYIFLFMCIYFIFVQLAISPVIFPENFFYVEQIINQGGWNGLKDYFTMDDLMWSVLHVFGVVILFITFFNVLMSLMYLIIFSRVSIVNNKSFLIRFFSKYNVTFIKSIKFMFLLLLGGFFASGISLNWINSDLPIYFNMIIDTVVNGKY